MSMGFYAAGAMGQGGGGGGFAFHGTTQTVQATATTPHAVSYPATVNAGDLLVALVTIRAASGDQSNPTLSGFTKLAERDPNALVTRVAVFTRIANGTEGGGTAALASADNTACAVQMMRFSGAGAVSLSSNQSVSETSVRPPNHTAPSGSNFYWICGFGSNGTAAPTAWPDGFSSAQMTTASGGAQPCRIISCAMVSSSNPVHPTAFTMASATNSGRFTIAIVIP